MHWKNVKVIFAIMILGIMFAATAFAYDTRVRISSVRITVDDSLRKMTYDDLMELPDINENEFSTPENGQYEVEGANWYNSASEITVGSQPQIEIFLTAQEKEKSDGWSRIYYFGGSYNSSNVHISGGTLVSANMVNSYELRVVIRLNGVEGQYGMPNDLQWSSGVFGTAVWSAPYNTSGFYEVSVLRENHSVGKITTNQTSCNLYPWMNKAGNYSFSVRTIPYTQDQKKAGKKSEENMSEELYVNEQSVSNGQGQNTNQIIGTYNSTDGSTSGYSQQQNATQYTVYNADTGAVSNMFQNGYTGTAVLDGVTIGTGGASQAGWYQNNGIWYFRNQYGQNVTNDWLLYNNRYYRLDSDGHMLTGWYQGQNGIYYFGTSGALKTGWAEINGDWYYFNPANGSNLGLRYTNQIVSVNNRKYYFDHEGKMRTGWISVKDQNGIDQFYYFYPKTITSGNDYGHMAVNTTVLGSYRMAEDGHWIRN